MKRPPQCILHNNNFVPAEDNVITLSYSRLPRDDEVYVMKAFTRHASHCSTCAHPYETYCIGDTLCYKGYQRALDVTKHVFSIAGQTYDIYRLLN